MKGREIHQVMIGKVGEGVRKSKGSVNKEG